MKRLLAFSLALGLFCIPGQAGEIAALADRIENLAGQAPLFWRIDTQLRAAELLMPVDPAQGKRLLSAGIELLRAHPEVRRSRGMIGSLLNLGVPDAENILLSAKDRQAAYEGIIFHFSSRQQMDKAAETLQAALQEGLTVNPRSARRILQDLAAKQPDKAATLRRQVDAMELKAALPGAARVRVYANLIADNDIPVDERASLVESALKEFDHIKEDRDASSAAGTLLDWSGYIPLEKALFDRVVAQYVRTSQKAGTMNYFWLARLQRARGSLGIDDPALSAQSALLDLSEAVQPHYDFSLTGLDGKQHRLSEQRGKVVLLNFWATWCPPCRAEMPLLEKLHREWGSKGLTIFAVTDETPEVVRGFLQQNRYTVPAMTDRTREVFAHYMIQGIPQTMLIDREGRVAALFDVLTEEGLVRAFRSAGLE